MVGFVEEEEDQIERISQCADENAEDKKARG
jgi:hypothetical protein